MYTGLYNYHHNQDTEHEPKPFTGHPNYLHIEHLLRLIKFYRASPYSFTWSCLSPSTPWKGYCLCQGFPLLTSPKASKAPLLPNRPKVESLASSRGPALAGLLLGPPPPQNAALRPLGGHMPHCPLGESSPVPGALV